MANKRNNKPRFTLAALFVWVAAIAILLATFVSFYPFGPLLAWLAAAAMIMAASTRYQDSRSTFAGIGFWMIGAGLLALPWFMVEGHCVPPHRLRRLSVGSTEAEVMSALGKPSSIEAIPAGGEQWYYSGITWCIVHVSFDPNGRVSEVSHDH